MGGEDNEGCITMTRVLSLVLVVLVAVSVIEAFLLVRSRNESERLKASERQRVQFCGFYRISIRTTRDALEQQRNAQDPRFRYDFYQLTTEPYLDVCQVREPTRSKMARRAWECSHPLGEEEDHACLARVARELEAALPFD